MTVTQVAGLVNNALKESIGETAVIAEDLSNVVDVGRAVFDANALDNYVKALVNHIGKVVFWDRPYISVAPSLMMDAWRFGSIKEKIRADWPEATDNDNWKLVDGEDYSPYIIHLPTVSAKFFNGRVASNVEQTIATEQVEESFSNEYQLAAFVSMLEGVRRNKRTLDNDNLSRKTMAAAIAYCSTKANQNVKLLTEYKAVSGDSDLTAANALYDQGFIRYAIYRMGLVMDQMRAPNKIFNSGGPIAFTPSDRLRVAYLTDFARSAGVYLHDAPNQFNTGALGIPGGDIVPFWQGTGTTGALADRAKVMVSKTDQLSSATTVNNILAMVWDEEAMGICNYKSKVETAYNPRTSTTNYFDKAIAGYFNDYNEQMVIFTAS